MLIKILNIKYKINKNVSISLKTFNLLSAKAKF